MKGSKIAPIIAICLLLVLIFSASYAYFDMYGGILNRNISTSVEDCNIAFGLVASNSLSLTFNLSDTTNSNGYVEVNGDDGIEALLYDCETPSMLTCSYDIIYTPDSGKTFTNSSTNTGNLKEFTLIGTDTSGTNSSFEFNLNGISSPTTIKSGTITANRGVSVSQIWNFKLRHYILNVNQNEQIGRTYSGKITFQSKGCA